MSTFTLFTPLPSEIQVEIVATSFFFQVEPHQCDPDVFDLFQLNFNTAKVSSHMLDVTIRACRLRVRAQDGVLKRLKPSHDGDSSPGTSLSSSTNAETGSSSSAESEPSSSADESSSSTSEYHDYWDDLAASCILEELSVKVEGLFVPCAYCPWPLTKEDVAERLAWVETLIEEEHEALLDLCLDLEKTLIGHRAKVKKAKNTAKWKAKHEAKRAAKTMVEELEPVEEEELLISS